MSLSQWVLDWVVVTVTAVLGVIVVASYMALLIGLFMPHSVDSKVILQIVSPALSATLGGFIGILSGLRMHPPPSK